MSETYLKFLGQTNIEVAELENWVVERFGECWRGGKRRQVVYLGVLSISQVREAWAIQQSSKGVVGLLWLSRFQGLGVIQSSQ